MVSGRSSAQRPRGDPRRFWRLACRGFAAVTGLAVWSFTTRARRGHAPFRIHPRRQRRSYVWDRGLLDVAVAPDGDARRLLGKRRARRASGLRAVRSACDATSEWRAPRMRARRSSRPTVSNRSGSDLTDLAAEEGVGRRWDAPRSWTGPRIVVAPSWGADDTILFRRLSSRGCIGWQVLGTGGTRTD